jgi:hypothetical protein
MLSILFSAALSDRRRDPLGRELSASRTSFRAEVDDPIGSSYCLFVDRVLREKPYPIDRPDVTNHG